MKNTVYYKNRLILFYYNRNKNFVLSFYTLYAISKLYIHTYYFTRLTLFNETVDFLFKIKEIDFIATGLAMTLSRSHVIDFTFPFESDPINFLVPYPRKNSTLGSILDPFRYKVSYPIFACIWL